jgi:hypothetical protein
MAGDMTYAMRIALMGTAGVGLMSVVRIFSSEQGIAQHSGLFGLDGVAAFAAFCVMVMMFAFVLLYVIGKYLLPAIYALMGVAVDESGMPKRR